MQQQRVYLDHPTGYLQSNFVRLHKSLSPPASHDSSPPTSPFEWILPSPSSSLPSELPSLDAVLLDLTDPSRSQAVLDQLTAISSATIDRPLLVIALSSYLSSAAPTTARRVVKEGGYQQRKAPPSCGWLKTLETAVLGLAREEVTVRVVAAGVVYGEGEEALLPLFRAAWLSEPLQLVGKGDNAVPSIHIRDLTSFILHCLTSPPEPTYLYAASPNSTTQAELITAIAARLGSGRVEPIDLATAALSPSFPGPLLTALTADVKLDAEYLKSVEMDWVCREGFVEAVGRCAEEFVQRRGARPVRVWVTGPPCSGRSHWSRRIGVRYHLPVLSLGEMVDEARCRGDALTAEINLELKEAEEKAALHAKEAAKKAPAKKAGKAEAAAEPVRVRLGVATLTKVVKRRMQEDSRVRNQGYVLDGYPRTREEAETLFIDPLPPPAAEAEEEAALPEEKEPESEAEQSAAEDGEAAAEAPPASAPTPRLNAATAPVSIVALQASEASCSTSLQRLTYAELIPGHNDEEGLKRRWRMWEEGQKDGQSAVELLSSAHVDVLELSEEAVQGGDERAWQLLSLYLLKGGKRENFHPTPAEARQEEEARQAEAARLQAEEEQREAERLATEQRLAVEKAASEEQRRRRVTAEEAELVEAASAPLRAYLLQHVMPALMDGLLEVVQTQPEDPVDYLAEWLYRRAMHQQATDTARTPATLTS